MFDRTGAQRVMANLSFLLVKQDVDLLLINDYAVSKEEEIDLPNQARRIILDDEKNCKFKKLRKNFYRIKKLRNILKNERPDIVLSFLEGPNKKMLLAAFGLKLNTTISVRCDPSSLYKNIFKYFLVNLLYSSSKHIIFQTSDAQKFFWKSIQKKGLIINNSVNEAFFNANYSGNSNYIVSFGRLEKEKNQQLLIKAFNNVQDKIPESELFIYGSGSLKNELINLSNNQRIHILDNISDVVPVLEACKVFALTSNHEGMPNALMEALAVGVPCVSTDCPCGGPKSLIDNGVNGYLINCDDQKALENSLISLFNDPFIRNTFSINGKKKALDFHPNEINKQWLEFFKLNV